jgi:hypothetical protein
MYFEHKLNVFWKQWSLIVSSAFCSFSCYTWETETTGSFAQARCRRPILPDRLNFWSTVQPNKGVWLYELINTFSLNISASEGNSSFVRGKHWHSRELKKNYFPREQALSVLLNRCLKNKRNGNSTGYRASQTWLNNSIFTQDERKTSFPGSFLLWRKDPGRSWSRDP